MIGSRRSLRTWRCSYWANAKLVTPLSRLTPDEFTQRVAGSYGSIRNTLSRRCDFTVPLFSFSKVMAVGEILHHAAIHYAERSVGHT